MMGELSWLLYPLFAAIVAAMFTTFVIWSRKETHIRLASVGLFVLALLLSAYLGPQTLGWPKWFLQGTMGGQELTLLGQKMVPGVGIYVLVDTGGIPRYFKLPWNKEMADKLQDMLDNPNNEGVKLKLPFEWSWDDRPPVFHPMPRPKILPDKLQPELRRPGFDT